MTQKQSFFLILMTLSFASTSVSQPSKLSLIRIAIDDSTSAVEFSQFRLRVTYPNLNESPNNPQLYFYDGIYSLGLGENKDIYLSIDLPTLSGIKAKLDSIAARNSRMEYGSGDQMDPETPEEFSRRRWLITNGVVDDHDNYYDYYWFFNNHRYGTRAYTSELTGFCAEGHTYIDSVCAIVRVGLQHVVMARKIRNFLSQEFALNDEPTSDLTRRVIIEIVRQHLFQILERMRVEKF